MNIAQKLYWLSVQGTSHYIKQIFTISYDYPVPVDKHNSVKKQNKKTLSDPLGGGQRSNILIAYN